MVVSEFRYADGSTPEGYLCADCGTESVRLYREYQTFLESQRLRCRCCAMKNQKKDAPDLPSEHTIGWLVAAVPTEDGSTYWGFSSVPDAGVEWWNKLPK